MPSLRFDSLSSSALHSWPTKSEGSSCDSDSNRAGSEGGRRGSQGGQRCKSLEEMESNLNDGRDLPSARLVVYPWE